ncbi:glycosyltransferase family 9 protein [Motilibacter aurantiacus]|uniref:glycosyltransferase family 9 protein n=1 Tax=Motilibacter aurantiacus TaxID=2714955 RepID=UPI00140B58EC|nr:glycosyltransferase family 9 protein [Motilibacter aurantiacus]NHC47295.1 glycosyltransferase family 9 protein [Motilibacter aurantiacus]
MTAPPVRRALFVELLGGFGDVLLALPAVHALALTHRSARLDVLTFTPGDVLLTADPLVGRVLATADHSEGAPRAAVEAALAAGDYDLVVTTTTYDGIGDLCRERSPWAVTNLWQGAPDGELVDRRFVRLLVDAGAVAAEHAGAPLRVELTAQELAAGEADVEALAPTAGPPPVVLVPGSGMPVKEWGETRWRLLAERLADDGHPVLSAVDRSTPPVAGSWPIPPGGLRELAARLAAVGRRGGVVVGGDTGPVRLGTAVGAPAVGLYGPTSAGRYGLRPGVGTALQGWPGCPVRLPSAITEQECWWSARCPFGDEPRCMGDIRVDDVLAAVRDRLGPARAPAAP